MNRVRTVAGMGVMCLLLLSGGCAPLQPLSPEQQDLDAAQDQCTEETNVMIGGWNGSPQWSSYFEWCMENKGVTPQELRMLWY